MQTNSDSRTAPESRSTEFVAVEGGAPTTSADTLMAVAYVAMWALVFGFLLLGSRRQRRIDERLADIDRALKASDRT
ncbi:MAG: hypothetical protein QM756_10295 [Polyangiaceae bacterium]